MAATAKPKVLELKPITPRIITVSIVGDTELELNKMDAYTQRMLIDERKDKAKSLEKPNEWEVLMTKIHWLNPIGDEFSEEAFHDALANNSPCITCFGLKKSFDNAVVRNNVSTYGTGFDATVNVIGAGNGLVPIKFTEHYIREILIQAKRGAPVLGRFNMFRGWSADIKLSILETAYSEEAVVNIINLAGFGLGIGSGRSSGYGRYHVVDVK